MAVCTRFGTCIFQLEYTLIIQRVQTTYNLSKFSLADSEYNLMLHNGDDEENVTVLHKSAAAIHKTDMAISGIRNTTGRSFC